MLRRGKVSLVTPNCLSGATDAKRSSAWSTTGMRITHVTSSRATTNMCLSVHSACRHVTRQNIPTPKHTTHTAVNMVCQPCLLHHGTPQCCFPNDIQDKAVLSHFFWSPASRRSSTEFKFMHTSNTIIIFAYVECICVCI